MYIIVTFVTIRYKLTASGNITRSILNYKLMRLISILRLHKEQRKQEKTTNSKKMSEKSVEQKATKNENFSKTFSIFS